MTDSPPGVSDELRERDLSDIPDERLTREERRELKRRFEEFVTAIRKARMEMTTRRKSKRVERWNPLVHGAKR